jgi:hypothetical protein
MLGEGIHDERVRAEFQEMLRLHGSGDIEGARRRLNAFVGANLDYQSSKIGRAESKPTGKISLAPRDRVIADIIGSKAGTKQKLMEDEAYRKEREKEGVRFAYIFNKWYELPDNNALKFPKVGVAFDKYVEREKESFDELLKTYLRRTEQTLSPESLSRLKQAVAEYVEKSKDQHMFQEDYVLGANMGFRPIVFGVIRRAIREVSK